MNISWAIIGSWVSTNTRPAEIDLGLHPNPVKGLPCMQTLPCKTLQYFSPFGRVSSSCRLKEAVGEKEQFRGKRIGTSLVSSAIHPHLKTKTTTCKHTHAGQHHVQIFLPGHSWRRMPSERSAAVAVEWQHVSYHKCLSRKRLNYCGTSLPASVVLTYDEYLWWVHTLRRTCKIAPHLQKNSSRPRITGT